MKKEDLRLKFKQIRRSALSAPGFDQARLLANLRRLLADLSESQSPQICLYRALKDEAVCGLTPVTRFFYPRVDGETISFFRPRSASAFVSGRFGISEPDPAQSQPLDPDQATLVVCPAVAVDQRGTRLGQGKGYYDRFFQANPRAVRLALVSQAQISNTVFPTDSWDQPVDWIVSEHMILKPTLKGARPHGSQFAS